MNLGRKIFFILITCCNLTALCQVPNPEHVASISNGAFGEPPYLQGIKSVVTANGYAYAMSYFTNSIEVFDVSNPAAPVTVSHVSRDSGFLIAMPKAMQIDGSNLFVVSLGDRALEIIDVSNPVAPRHAGRVVHGDGGAQLNSPKDIAVSNGYAFILVSGGLEIIDVSTPDNPVHVKFLDLDGNQLKVSGNYAYVISQTSMIVIDISVSSAPVIESSLNLSLLRVPPAGSPLPFFVANNYAYHAWTGSGSNDDGLVIINVSDPKNPQIQSILREGNNGARLQDPSAIFVGEGNAYIASANKNTLEIIDVQNPANPMGVSALVQLGLPESITIANNLAFVGGSQSLNLVDITNPTNLTLVKSINNGLSRISLKYLTDISLTGDEAYVLSATSIEAFDISNPKNIKPITRLIYPTDGINGFTRFTSKIYANGEHVFLLNNARLSIFDKAFNEVGYAIGENWNGGNLSKPFVSVRGRYVFWMTHYGGLLEVTDISDPTKPTKAGELDLFFDRKRSVCLSGNYIYAVNNEVLKVVDISNPRKPVTISTLAISYEGGDQPSNYLDEYQITTGNGMAFILIHNSLLVVDVANPSSPRMLNNLVFETSGNSKLRFHQGYLYVANPDSKTLEIVDFADPTQPQIVSTLKNSVDSMMLYAPLTMAFSGSHAYIGNTFGLEIIDLNIPLVTGIASEQGTLANNSLTLFPNPALNEISLACNEFESTSPVIVNINTSYGKQVVQTKWSVEEKVNLDISNLNPGVYFVSVWNGSMRFNTKFIKL